MSGPGGAARANGAKGAPGGTARADGARLLVVDDDPLVLGSLAALLEAEGFRVEAAASAEEAWRRMGSGSPPDLVVTDIQLPGADGIDLLGGIKERHASLPVIVITGQPSRDAAIRCLDGGAADFVAKPIDDTELVFRVRRLLGEQGLRREIRHLRDQIGLPEGFAGLIGRHQGMRAVFATVAAVAETRATLLIHGESGTGKTMLARALHLQSERRAGPFVEVACGALPEDLIESELFGHVRGSFTGAVSDRRGKIEAANGGTLFLDEVGVASQALQVKLLRVLQERAFERVGDSATIRVDIRLVLATNMNLEDEVRAGRFRQDLFYRINVVAVDLPPLRERLSDIPALAEHFLAKFAREHDRPARRYHPEVMTLLCRHPWPGNVRELENTIERAVVLSRSDELTPADLPPRLLAAGEPASPRRDGFVTLRDAMDPFECDYLRRVLRSTRGNRLQAADILGINRSTLFNKMRKHALLDEEFGGTP